MAEIQLEGIVKNYGAHRAIHGVDLHVKDGEFVAFVGPSGCGKSTMLRMIAGLEEISGGTLRIGGRVVNTREEARAALQSAAADDVKNRCMKSRLKKAMAAVSARL